MIDQLRWFLRANRPPQGLADMTGVSDVTIVNDENILGGTQRAVSEGHLYAISGDRLRRCMRLFKKQKVSIFLGLRDPVSFMTSSYCENIRGDGYRSFAEHLGGTSPEALKWSGLINRIARQAPDCPIVVWPFEAYRDAWREILIMLLDLEEKDKGRLRWLAQEVRPGMSDRVFQEIRSRAENNKAPLSSEELDVLMQEFPKTGDNPAPSFFSPDEIKQFSQMYQDDLEVIKQMPNVRFIG